MKKLSLLALAGTMALVGVGQAQAQAQPTYGAAVPGQCVLDLNAVVNNTKMAQSAGTRLEQIGAQVSAELQPQADTLAAEESGLVATAKTNPTGAAKTTFDGKVAAYEKKAGAFQQKYQLRQGEMQATGQKMQGDLYNKAIPYISSVVSERGCSMVINAGSLVRGVDGNTPFSYVNPAMDITTAVVQKIDASGEMLPPFDRVRLDQQQQGAAPQASTPAPTPAPKTGAAKK